MQVGHFLHEVEAEAGALAPAAGARQGVEALGEAGQGVVGDGVALVEQAQRPVAALALGGEADEAAGGREVQGVVQQVGQGLAQQEALPLHLHVVADGVVDAQAGRFDARRLGLHQLIHHRRHRHADALFQALALLDLGQVQQPLDQLLQARALAGDVGDEALPLLGGHVALQQFGGAPDGCQGALQFMGQGVHVALDVGLALQFGAHALHGAGQLSQFAAAEAGQFGPLPFADGLGIAGQAPQGAAEPPGEQAADQQPEDDEAGAEPGQAHLGAVDVGLQRAVGLGHRDDAYDLPVGTDRRRHVHHRGVGVGRVFTGGAGPVLAAQGQQDVVPAGVVLAHGLAGGVQQHAAGAVGDVDAVVDLGLAHAPDLGAGLALAVGLEQLGQVALGEGAVAHRVAEDLGQQVGGVHQGFLGGLAHTGADLVHDGAEHEVTGQADEEEVDQEDSDAQWHGRSSGRGRAQARGS